jgi:signal transduction histidine kinase
MAGNLATTDAPKISGTQPLRPRARILRTLGDELISSETVALIELVKNAYDADATRVLVRFCEPIEIDKGKIEVIDNGHGMSLETIRTTWMEPATLVKRRRTRSESGLRRVLGEKGIGRFAAARLADFLEVVTRRADSKEIRVFFDWSQFDDEQKYLDQVEVLWEETEPAEICPGGTIQVLWGEKEKPENSKLNHGTVLRMERVRTIWSKEQIEKLRTDLSRLVSPFSGRDKATYVDGFQIRLELPPPFQDYSGVVSPSEALQNPHYTVSGDVDQTGHCNLVIKLRGRKEEPIEKQFKFSNSHAPQCGPFHIELRVWDREAKDLAELVELYGSTLKNVRGDLDKSAGINIYRDGFRVLPYGEPRNDWLRLDLRRVQNPTLRLSNNQIIGYVLISADANPQLRDQSNREGLMDGPALDDLSELVKMVLAELEERRYQIRERRQITKPGGLFAGFDLALVRDLIKKRHPEDSELLALVGEKEDDLEKRVKAVQEVLSRYRRLATLGQLIDTILHDGRAPLSKINNEAELGQRDIERTHRGKDGLIERLGQRFAVVVAQSGVLATVFRKIEPFGGRKRGRPTPVRLERVIADAFAVLESEIAEVGVQEVNLPQTDTQVTVDQSEIQQVIVNLLQNSLYWLRQVPQENRRVTVVVCRKDSDEVEILFSDNGPGVEAEFQEHIFAPYFSTKPDGVGLGLTIAGEIVSEYYAGSLELLDSGPLSGATFRITLHRRV